MRVAARDTDGLLFALDGDANHFIDVLSCFVPLSPDGVSPFWSIDAVHDGRLLYGLVLGPKRYVLFTRNDDGSLHEVMKFTEHALAGAVADPPALPGRTADRKHRWAAAVATVAVEATLRNEEPAMVFRAPWDLPDIPPFPVIARLQISNPSQLKELAARGLVLRPFGRYVRAERDRAFGSGGSPVALDPGTDLAEWDSLEWRENGEPVKVTTIPGEPGVVLATLATKARRWLRPRIEEPPCPVTVSLIRRAGRAGPVLDAMLVDPEIDADELRVQYVDGALTASLQDLAVQLGPRAFARASGISRSSAARLRHDVRPASTALRRALRGLSAPMDIRVCSCGQPIARPNAKACSSCAKRARDRRYRERKAGVS